MINATDFVCESQGFEQRIMLWGTFQDNVPHTVMEISKKRVSLVAKCYKAMFTRHEITIICSFRSTALYQSTFNETISWVLTLLVWDVLLPYVEPIVTKEEKRKGKLNTVRSDDCTERGFSTERKIQWRFDAYNLTSACISYSTFSALVGQHLGMYVFEM